MRELLGVLKALGDENRLRVLWALGRHELCVCQIVELLGLAQSTVSKHLAILHQARLIDGRKQGRWMFYRAAGRHAPAEARRLAAAVRELLSATPRAIEDAARLETIVKTDRDELCRKQHRCRS